MGIYIQMIFTIFVLYMVHALQLFNMFVIL